MTTFQKVIKYGAIAFGIFLSINIISAIVMGITIVAGITLGIDASKTFTNTEVQITQSAEIIKEMNNVKNIKIDVTNAKLIVRKSDELKLEANNVAENFQSKIEGTTLKITDEKSVFNWNGNAEQSEILLHIPENLELENINIKTGVNETYIEYLQAKEIDIECGVGTLTIDKINANKLEIDTGAGKSNINNCTVEELDLDTGAGKVEFSGIIKNNAHIDCGIGKTDIELQDTIENYKFRVQTGIGSITINNETMSDSTTYGNGNSNIKINGGIGAVDITTE